jgi:hypothetical protein
MQRKSRGVLLALVAVFAMSAVTAAAASAVKPEFKPVPAKKKFTGKAPSYTWEHGGQKIECTESSLAGELTGAQTVGKVVITWSGCRSITGVEQYPVNSEGAKAGEIVTKPLSGELGTVAKSEAESGVGLRFKPESKKNWFVLQERNGYEPVFAGTLAAELSGLSLSTKHTLFPRKGKSEGMKIKEITLDSGVVEKPRFEAGGKEVSLETDYQLTFEEPVEIT